jgi:hypothetical protein
MLTDLKPILASRTVWANLVGFAALMLGIVGVPLNVIGDEGQIVDAILKVVAGSSFLASTAFRIIATRRLV